MDNDDQIQQEQERDFRRAEADIERLLGRISRRASALDDGVICGDVDELRGLIKRIGG